MKGELGSSLAERTYVDPLNLIQVILAEGKIIEYRFDTKVIIETSIIVGLSLVLNFIKVFQMPQDGSITLGCMVPIFLLSFNRSEFLNKDEIIAAIKEKISYNNAWFIGVTDDPGMKREELDKKYAITVWYHWKADSEQTAFKVTSYFIQKGMKGTGGGGGKLTFVYIFL